MAIPEFTIKKNKTYIATVKTSMGTFHLELYDNQAPCAVNSFVSLARQRFYDGLTFHRVVKDFVIQGGDPTGTGSGGPGYTFNDELDNDLKYELGTLAMANSGPNTNGSQWFVVASETGRSAPQELHDLREGLAGHGRGHQDQRGAGGLERQAGRSRHHREDHDPGDGRAVLAVYRSRHLD